MTASKPSLPQELAAMSAIVVEMANYDIRIIRAQWTEYDGIEIGVSSRDEFDRAVDTFGLFSGELFGDVRTPSVGATGMVGAQHIRVYGPADKR